MPSSYKRLGDYISETNERNSDLNDYPLLGVSIQKMFMPSIANIIGTDMSTYKIVYRNQFAYGPVTSRNGDRISIALLSSHDAVLISQAYTSFSINDVNKLDPEYLMMWFRRPEFDRYARFKSHGSAREIFDWQELCDTKLPIPSIEKQRAIVKEYNTVEQRINLNNQLIQKLEDTAQTIYKDWFVDFEFPNEDGKPYKSSGGKMVYNEELEKEIPDGWEVYTIKDFCIDIRNGSTPSRLNVRCWNSEDIPWLKTGEISNNVIYRSEEYISNFGHKSSSTYLFPINTVLMAMYGVTAGQLGFLKFESTTNQACCGMICDNLINASFLFFTLLNQQSYIKTLANGGAQANLSKTIIEKLKLIVPQNMVLLEKSFLYKIIEKIGYYTYQNILLTTMENLLLSRLAKES